MRRLMLAILCADICVSYLPYYTFVPILPQGMEVYGVEEATMNIMCILYALAFVPCAFLTGPVMSKLGCRGTFVLAMVIEALGCALRCGPAVMDSFHFHRSHAHHLKVKFASRQESALLWLIAGQALCALGQPFLVNSTSQMIAEWFPPQERPWAAMVANLMNFVGGSMSFMLPPMIVDVEQKDPKVMAAEVSNLLLVEFKLALVLCVVTFFCFERTPSVPVLTAHRPQVTFYEEVRKFLSLKDFWLVNGQFMIYVAACHSFDAVEGSLLESNGYSAALSSWSAASCSLMAIAGTYVETYYITEPKSYQPALLAINGVLAISLALCFASLYFRLHAVMFVVAVGVMGLATPGWGCTFELGSEVCFPAREASVSSLLEACSNLMAVAGIIVSQRLIDAGLGSGVLVLMAIWVLGGGGLLFGLSGRLRRSEAEAMAEIELEGLESPPRSESEGSRAEGSAHSLAPNLLSWFLSWVGRPLRKCPVLRVNQQAALVVPSSRGCDDTKRQPPLVCRREP